MWLGWAEFSHLEHIAFAGHHLIQNWIDEKPDEEAGDQSGHNHDGEWLIHHIGTSDVGLMIPSHDSALRDELRETDLF